MGKAMKETIILIFAALALAQNVSQSNSPTITFSGTAVRNPSALATRLVLNVEDMWNMMVGPIEEASTTTTVSPTAVPSSSLIPPPPLYYSPFPTGAQVPLQKKNESWSFPKDFWGVAGAAYQVEGAAKDEGRGPSIWDVLSHRVTDYITDNFTADISDNNYYMYKDDIARIAAMGVKAYSFSISWSRIQPFGRGPVNELAIAHYNDVINTCLENNIIPLATLYHWDLPLALQDSYGGWLDSNIVEDFVEYARIAYSRFGDRVKYWFTVNEPIVFCDQYPLAGGPGYFKSFAVPEKEQPWYCGQNVILAHAHAYRLGKKMMPDSVITYKNNGGYKIPLTSSAADQEAVQRAYDFNEGWFSDPIFLTGDYNAAVKKYVSTFLRPFTESEKRIIKGSTDMYAHDAYTSQFYFAPDGGIEACLNDPSNELYPSCANTSYTYSAQDGGWLIGPAADPLSPWLHRATDWVPAFMRYIKDTWADPAGNLPIAISEFGFSEPFEYQQTFLPNILYDVTRMSYYQDYMEAILIALSEGINIVGCLAWSFVDNYEWQTGYVARFGMQYVNMSDPSRQRIYKGSFFQYASAFQMYQEK